MAAKINNNGFSLTGLMLILTVVLTVVGIGLYVRHEHVVKQKPVEPTSSLDPNSGSFSECATSGGTIGNTGGSQSGGTNAATETVDLVANTLWCQATGNKTHIQDIWFATDEAGYDTKCQNTSNCTAVEAAAKPLCSPAYGVQANTSDPTFMYYPVIMGNFARLKLSDCSKWQYRSVVTNIVFMKQLAGNWTIYKEIVPASDPSSLKQSGIPIELLSLY
jgi:hypothetical protein